MADHTVRGKMVRLRKAKAEVASDGSVTISAEFGPVVLTEAETIDLYQVLADVIEYGPGDGTGTTEGATERGMDRA
jgi:hypothetical protein